MPDHLTLLATTRESLIARMRKARAEIQQIFDDADYWNRTHVPSNGAPIDPDPDGQLERLAYSLDIALSQENA